MKPKESNNIRNRLFIAIALLTAGIFYFSYNDIVKNYKSYKEMKNTKAISEFTVQINYLIHEIQKERGTSAGLLGSKNDSEFSQTLMQQRKTTDLKLENLITFYENFDKEILDEKTKTELSIINTLNKELSQKREEISKHAISASKAIDFYTDINTKLLNNASKLILKNSNTETLNMERAYLNLSKHKESAGIERALLSNVFAQNYIASNQSQHLIKLITEEKIFLNNFISYATPEQKNLYEQQTSGSLYKEIEDFRKIALNNIGNTDLNIDAKEWFDKKTKKLNIIKNIEDKTAEDLINLVKDKENTAKTNLFIHAFLIIVIILFLLFMLFEINKVLQSIKKLAIFSKNIADGNLNDKINYNKNNEIGGISKSLNTLLQNYKNLVNIIKLVSTGDIDKAEDFAIRITNSNSSNDFTGEKTELNSALFTMLKEINKIIFEIKNGANNIADAGNNLDNISSSLSEGTGEQAASTEEVSASMEQMVANINQNSENANIAEEIANNAEKGMVKSNDSFNLTVTAMKKIAEKVSVISKIAQKTDILAINAAIEAARAGEQGKGFAVVALEIRKLAENSQTSAKEINELAESTVFAADNSAKLMSELVPDIQKNLDLVKEINLASREQNSGAEQINDAIQALTGVIQKNTVLASDMTDNTKKINTQADMLKHSVDFFKINNNKFNEIKKENKENNKLKVIK